MDLLHKSLRASGLNQSTLNNYLVTDAYADKRSGHFIVYLQQAYLGIPVYNKIGVYIFRNDTLVEKKANFIPKIESKAGPKATYTVEAVQAIRFAANHLSIPLRGEPTLVQKDAVRQRYVYSAAGLSRKNISADLVWLPMNDGQQIRLSWNVRVTSPDGNDDWFVRIDARSGEFIGKNSLIISESAPPQSEPAPSGEAWTQRRITGRMTLFNAPPAVAPIDNGQGLSKAFFGTPAVASVGYRVYPFPVESANFGARTLENNPWLRAAPGNNAISLGWHYDNTTNYEYTRGNNVWAQQDLAGTNATTGFADTSSTLIPGLTFDRTTDGSVSPSSYSNIRAGIDNLFYWNNIMHDISYQYGFDEAAGNFQADNQGRGGEGNDFVHAFAEDGAGINNADFATPPDGENPRMRMFQWNSTVTLLFHVNSPAPIATDYTVAGNTISLNTQLTTSGPITADIVLADDVPATTHQACGTIGNAASLAGKIALIDRGGCNFVLKIKAAQNAGAVAVIVVNSSAAAPTLIGGTDATITIPAVMISQADGNTLKANLTGLNGSLSATGVNRDGALDNGIISHEYTHGISTRLTGGPANSGCLVNAEQMGEGWSDYMALMVTTDWSTATLADGAKKRPLGTYALSQPATGKGIRTYPYSTDMSINPWTYDMLATSTGGEVHTVGEIWCATIWDMTWNIIQMEGIDPDIYHGTKGNNIALQLVIEGMKYQPCSPGFLDARDAILKADSLLYNYAHKCAIWNAFARRGMGKSASQGSSDSYTDQTAATDLPSGMGISQTVDKTLLVHGDNVTYTIKAYCDCSPLSNISIVDTLSSNLSYLSSPGGTYTAPYVHFDGLNFAANETKIFTIQASVAGTYRVPDTLINDSRDPGSYTWASTVTTGGTFWSESTVRSHSSSHAWYALDQATLTDLTLTSGNLVLDTLTNLSFWHYFETDPAYDGGVVEISTDGGSSWQDLGPFMTQNPYNSSLDPTATNIGNRKAFTGSSGGSFIRTIISLTGFAGATAKIRFRFTSDNAVGGEGWYIDDIVLTNGTGAVGIASAYNSGALLSRSNTVSPFAPGALPVNFLSFEAKKQNSSAWLHWKVNGAIDVDKYVVERSAGGSNFISIGEVPEDPAGSANPAGSGEKEYTFTDIQPLNGNDFYRIVETDKDGKSTLSAIRLLRFGNKEAIVRLSPVPTYNHIVQVDIETDNDAPIAASLINTVGQTIKMYTVKQGPNLLSLDNFPKGIYFLKIQTSRSNLEIKKIMIQ